jgi:hypothetical protein
MLADVADVTDIGPRPSKPFLPQKVRAPKSRDIGVHAARTMDHGPWPIDHGPWSMPRQDGQMSPLMRDIGHHRHTHEKPLWAGQLTINNL